MKEYIIFNEIKIRQTDIKDICDMIREKLAEHHILDYQAIIDAAANAPESNGVSKSDQYKQNKIYVRNANKTLEGALERINSLFKTRRIWICGNCIYLLRDIESYSRGEDGKPKKGTGNSAYDLADAFRYFINEYGYGGPDIQQKSSLQILHDTRSSSMDKYMAYQFAERDYKKQNPPGKMNWV